MKKRMVALFLVVVLALSVLSTVALAAYPTATLRSVSTTSVKRGKTITFKFYLNSGSYTKQSGYYRSRFNSYILKGSVNGDAVADNATYFTGRGNFNLKWKVPKTTKKGKYVNLYGTFYRYSIYSNSWYVNTARTKNFKVK